MILNVVILTDETYDKSFKISMSIKGITPQHKAADIVKVIKNNR